MKGMRILVLYFVLTAAFAGCRINQEPRNFEKPTAKMVGFGIQDVKLDFATLLFDIEINNPYPDELSLLNLSYSLSSGGDIFLTATHAGPAVVPPNKKQVLSLPDEVIYARLLKSLNAKAGSEIPYQAVLRLSVEAPKTGVIEIPFTSRGFLTLPEAVEINVDGEIYNALDVIYVSTPHDVVEKMLEVAKVTKDDLVYDLGCGDGRIPVMAAKKYGCKAVGYDIDPERIKDSLENVEKNQVGHLVKIEQKDIFTLDLSQADVITIYLLPDMNMKLIPQLEKLKPGSRIVAHSFGMGTIEPDEVVKYTSSEDRKEHLIFLWTAPLRKK